MNISDRELNRLGANFRLKKILMRLHVTFWQYLYAPDRYDNLIRFMDRNKHLEPFIIGGGRRALH